jgi:hypothetical protein
MRIFVWNNYLTDERSFLLDEWQTVTSHKTIGFGSPAACPLVPTIGSEAIEQLSPSAVAKHWQSQLELQQASF